jgi:hypothetical protein
MSLSVDKISNMVVRYTGDYRTPLKGDRAGWCALRKKYHTDDKHQAWKSLQKDQVAALDLIERYALGHECGSYKVTIKGTETEVTVTVTKFVNKYFLETYQAWTDLDHISRKMGDIDLEVLRTAPSGRVITHSPNLSHRERFALQLYGQTRPGFIFVRHVKAYANDQFRGIGSGLMQIAAEASYFHGFDVSLMLLALEPKFFRKFLMTTGDLRVDAALDLGLPSSCLKFDFIYAGAQAADTFFNNMIKNQILYGYELIT